MKKRNMIKKKNWGEMNEGMESWERREKKEERCKESREIMIDGREEER